MLSLRAHTANFITLLNALFGFLGCIAMIQDRFDLALIALIAAAIADFLDGFIARILKVESAFGNFMDSMADVISFGLFPSLWWYFSLSESLSVLWAAGLASLLFVSALLRLVRFSVYPSKSIHFEGLPTPAMALFVVLITQTELFDQMAYFTPVWFKRAAVFLTLLFSGWMVSKIPAISLKFKDYTFKANILRYLVMLSAIVGFVLLREELVLVLLPTYTLGSLLIKR
ncbi:MAG: CDP-alcohol phosphatidyltransferase family protein [Flavobacteriaceae bacterium]